MNRGESCERARGETIPFANMASIGFVLLTSSLVVVVVVVVVVVGCS